MTFPWSPPPVPAVVDRLAGGRPVRAVWINEERLRTGALAGLSAVHPRWLAAPDVTVRAIGAGLRLLHDRLPVWS